MGGSGGGGGAGGGGGEGGGGEGGGGGGALGGGGGRGLAARVQKSANRSRIELMSVPRYECRAIGSLAIELSVATDAPPRPTANRAVRSALMSLAASMAVRSPASEDWTPSESSQMILRAEASGAS